MQSKAILGEQEVQAILAAATAEAKKNGWNVAISVVDDGGFLLGMTRLDGCAPMGSLVSLEKAHSAAISRKETKVFEDMVNGGRYAFLTAPLSGCMEGGVPVVVDGHTVGAVGVSGVAKEQDAQIAKAGVAAVA